MAVNIDGPVGLRWRTQKVRSFSRDQDNVISLLAAIPASQGGKKEEWEWPPLAGQDGDCPKFLAEAIWNFQKFWNAKRALRVVDGVVDPNGSSLRLLNSLAAGGSVQPTPPKPSDKPLPLDIILRFTGGPTGNQRDMERENGLRRAFNTPAYLQTHQPIEAICYTGFREQEQFVDSAVSDVARRRAETGEGVTIVIGSSAGGVSAIKAACKLREKNIRLNYLGINDAAFLSSKNEVTFKPAFGINLTTVTGGRRIDADIKENFFQTVGHGWQSDSSSPTGYFPYAEFHGPLSGFLNADLRTKPRVIAVIALYSATPVHPVRVRDQFAALVHKEAGAEAENLIWPRITALIKP